MREYDGEPMREVLLDRLSPSSSPTFLVYLMEPVYEIRARVHPLRRNGHGRD